LLMRQANNPCPSGYVAEFRLLACCAIPDRMLYGDKYGKQLRKK
jgi:hypothetical protein